MSLAQSGAEPFDAVVCGAGPSGAAAAILLAGAGWRVLLVEQQRYPRQKVCGECISAGSLAMLDALGVGAAVRQRAGPELQRVAWLRGEDRIVAALPACAAGPYAFGRALGRDCLDSLLVERARRVGVAVRQPAKLKAWSAHLAGFDCWLSADPAGPARETLVRAPILIDAHGSWESGPRCLDGGARREARAPRAAPGAPTGQAAAPLRAASDLFGFKASFHGAALAAGLLPVLSFAGGYGGMVQAEDGRVTLACCIRRDTLRACRARAPGVPAGEAVERYLRDSCRGVATALAGATRGGSWYSVGPVRPGIRDRAPHGVLCIGNAAGETHPLIGEGITMALQSAFLLVEALRPHRPAGIDAGLRGEIESRYRRAWRAAFTRRLRFAAIYAALAMRPVLSGPAARILRHWPGALTSAARWAGKAGTPFDSTSPRAALT
jgi:2-polyprenyl-6-methoxyphenol hydroxylase-like FAD-dependent oxidoreductase